MKTARMFRGIVLCVLAVVVGAAHAGWGGSQVERRAIGYAPHDIPSEGLPDADPPVPPPIEDPAINHLQCSRWFGAFEPGMGPVVIRPGFPAHQDEKFFIEIVDAGANKNSALTETITATLKSKWRAGWGKPNGTRGEDIIKNFLLGETGPDTGVFRSKYLVIVSDDEDDNYPPNFPDNGSDDRTIKCLPSIKGKVSELKIEYKGQTKVLVPAVLPSSEMFFVKTKFWIVRAGEPYLDENGNGRYDAGERYLDTNLNQHYDVGETPVTRDRVWRDMLGMQERFAPACIQFLNLNLGALLKKDSHIVVVDLPGGEPFQDIGLVGQPGTAGNGAFDFNDVNANFLHDPGEPSEPFTDHNGNGGYDFWIVLNRPAATVNNPTYDTLQPRGVVPQDQEPDTGLDSCNQNVGDWRVTTREQRTLIDTLGDKSHRTLDIFYVQSMINVELDHDGGQPIGRISHRIQFTRPIGEALIRSQHASEKTRNTILMAASDVDLDGIVLPLVLAHEAGHILTDDVDKPNEPPWRLMRGSNLTREVTASKRLTKAETDNCRTKMLNELLFGP